MFKIILTKVQCSFPIMKIHRNSSSSHKREGILPAVCGKMKLGKGNEMKKKSVRLLAAGLSAAMLLTQSLPGIVLGAPAEGESGLTSFEQEFKNPDEDAKPFMRWWIAPGRMTETEIRKEIENFAKGGYAGVELQCLEMAKDCVINDATWNRDMKWILQAGKDYGVQIDFTVGQFWPVATPEIKNADDKRAEQQIWEASVDFKAESGKMNYKADSLVFPQRPENLRPQAAFFDEGRPYELIAAVAAKVSGNGYDPATVVVLADSENQSNGAIDWTAPSAGDWKIFYYYMQASNKVLGYGMNQYVIDHMSKEGTQAVIDNWESAMNSDSALKTLYEENGGSIFGDSFELSSSLWTPKMLEEFKTRRGYDLAPYLPAINNDLGTVGERVRDDLYTTMTELLAENHMGALQKWANSHNMKLRYQAYSSAGSSVFELTYPALNIDIVEAESYAMSHTASPDDYRQLSGIVHMKGDTIFSAEAAETTQDDWRETWMDTQTKAGETPYAGFMYYANRLFSGGVNKLVFHGSTYKFTDTEKMFFPVTQTWPGYSAMSALNYGNEWDDKTPMWSNVDIMTDFLARTEMVLQQGKADIDVAVYRSQYGKGNTNAGMTALEKAGYTYDYVTPTVLHLDKAIVGEQDGKKVLAADGPSYKALVIEPLGEGNNSPMPLDVAEKIVAAAKSGLPVVIIGDLPTRANSYPGKVNDVSGTVPEENDDLQTCLAQLNGLDNVKTAANRENAVDALKQLGVVPDAQPAKAGDTYFQHRTTDQAELYYAYNSGSSANTQSITLKGVGTPYLLDPWSGNITPIAQYTAADGSVTIPIDLASQDTMLVAIAKPGWSSKAVERNAAETDGDAVLYDSGEDAVYKLGVQSVKGGDVSVTFGDGTKSVMAMDVPESEMQLTDWSMVLNQWTEGGSVFETKVVPTKEYKLSGPNALKPWYEIDEALTNTAGVAEYTTTFALKKGWQEGQGAYLAFDDMSDVGRLFVNGQEVPMNQLSLKTDIGKYLVAGNNTIKVQVSSNLANVKYAKEQTIQGWDPDKGPIDIKVPAENTTYAFGIMGNVVLTPYSHMAVEEVAQNASKRADKAEAEAAAAKADAEKQVNEANAAKAEAEANLKKAQANADELKRQADAKAQEVANAQNATAQQRREAEQAKAAADAAQKELAAARAELKKAQEKADKLTFLAKKITLSKVTSPKKKQAKATWKKVSGAAGYQIQYSTKSNFKGKKTLPVKGGKKTSAVIKKLSSKKKYYVRIRAYKKIGGKNVYTSYSAAKSVKVK